MKKPPKNICGHFSSLFKADGNCVVATSLTTRRKSRHREIEDAKKQQLLADIAAITGAPASAMSRSFDGVKRRWTGIKELERD